MYLSSGLELDSHDRPILYPVLLSEGEFTSAKGSSPKCTAGYVKLLGGAVLPVYASFF
jgi:hypothetical protein